MSPGKKIKDIILLGTVFTITSPVILVKLCVCVTTEVSITAASGLGKALRNIRRRKRIVNGE